LAFEKDTMNTTTTTSPTDKVHFLDTFGREGIKTLLESHQNVTNYMGTVAHRYNPMVYALPKKISKPTDKEKAALAKMLKKEKEIMGKIRRLIRKAERDCNELLNELGFGPSNWEIGKLDGEMSLSQWEMRMMMEQMITQKPIRILAKKRRIELYKDCENFIISPFDFIDSYPAFTEPRTCPPLPTPTPLPKSTTWEVTNLTTQLSRVSCYDLNKFNSGCNERQRLEGEKGIINELVKRKEYRSITTLLI
jgi:hypothetical protein